MSQNLRKPLQSILSSVLLLVSLEAGAAQVLQGNPDDTLAASISRSEPTLIRVEGAKIRRVLGAEGDFDVRSDKDTGTVFIKPLNQDKQHFTAFVADSNGQTWKLLLAATDNLPDSIVIKGKRRAVMSKVFGKDLPRSQAIKRVILALESDQNDEMEVRDTHETIPLWQEASFVLVKEVDGPYRGEKFVLTNTSARPMLIDERELFRRDVVAVAIEQPSLAPGESTSVLVVTEVAE